MDLAVLADDTVESLFWSECYATQTELTWVWGLGSSWKGLVPPAWASLAGETRSVSELALDGALLMLIGIGISLSFCSCPQRSSPLFRAGSHTWISTTSCA
jgi:hypothetical protein